MQLEEQNYMRKYKFLSLLVMLPLELDTELKICQGHWNLYEQYSSIGQELWEFMKIW